MRVFGAMLVDAYRQLNSRKLFWVTFGLSAVAVLLYGSMGFDENGVSMWYGLQHVDSEYVTSDSPLAGLLYRSIFTSFMVGIWLAWIATILALISTTSIFPDFLADGAIDIVLSKPIGRLRLFVYKYLTSLLFVFLQVTLFSVGVFLCLGLRLGDWDWRILLAIPIVTVFYSYLFAVNVLVGTWTRSALTALLVTLLLWFLLFTVNATEILINQQRTNLVVQRDGLAAQIERTDAQLERLDADDDEQSRNLAGNIRATREMDQARHDEIAETLDKIDRWHGPIRAGQAVLPKTSDTIGLLDRWLAREGDVNFMDILGGRVAPDGEGGFTTTDQSPDREVQQRMIDEYDERGVVYIVGTSLAFEFVVLGLAALIFVRRDY